MENNTAKHFVLQLGSLVSLYLSLSFLLVLLFNLINIAMPDVADGYYGVITAKDGIKWGIAMVIVFFPAYLILTRIVNAARRTSSNHNYLGLTKWLIYLSILIAGGVLLGDLVAVIMSYLNGDITTRFVLKALSLLVIIGSAFTYYLLDAKGYWMTREKESKLCALGASLVVIVVLVFGFMNVDTPAEARDLKIDGEQITDLQNIQYSIQNHLLINNSLPASLNDLGSENLPSSPAERTPYEYKLTEKGFQLCATFAQPSIEGDPYYETYPMVTEEKSRNIIGMENWQHKAGLYCFERVVK